MANLPQKLILPYYVSTRSTHKEGTEQIQLTFELRDSNNCLVDIPPSSPVPVCAIHVPQTSLPHNLASKIFPEKLPSIVPFVVLDSLGTFTVEVHAEKGQSGHEYLPHMADYLRIIAYGMGRCLKFKLPSPNDKDSGSGIQFEIGIRNNKPPHPEGPQQVKLNLGKMFVDKLFGTSAPFPEFSQHVSWDFTIDAQSASSTAQRQIVHVVSVPSYALKRPFSDEAGKSGEWTLVSQKAPKIQIRTTMKRTAEGTTHDQQRTLEARSQPDRKCYKFFIGTRSYNQGQ